MCGLVILESYRLVSPTTSSIGAYIGFQPRDPGIILIGIRVWLIPSKRRSSRNNDGQNKCRINYRDFIPKCLQPGRFIYFKTSNHAKEKIAHIPLNTRPIALCIVNYKKSVTVRKIFKNSSKLDQAECCNFFCFKMTTK